MAIAAAAMVKNEVGVIIKAESDVANGPRCMSLETRRFFDARVVKSGRKLLRRGQMFHRGVDRGGGTENARRVRKGERQRFVLYERNDGVVVERR